MLTRPLLDAPLLWLARGGRRDVTTLHVAAAHNATDGADLYVPSDLHQARRTLADEFDGDERVWEGTRALLFQASTSPQSQQPPPDENIQ